MECSVNYIIYDYMKDGLQFAGFILVSVASWLICNALHSLHSR